MKEGHLTIILILCIVAIFVLSVWDRNRGYTRIRSEVIMATGYDILYPEKWKGVCK